MVLKIEYLTYEDKIETSGGIAVLGFFDGVHIAHQALIKKGQKLKETTGKPLVVFTFDQSIGKYLRNLPFYYLTSIDDKAALMAPFDVDILYVFKVSKPFISIEADEFVQLFLKAMDHLVVGFDFTYGFRSLGNVSDLLTYTDFKTHVMPEMSYQDEKIGSTKIRQYLDQGDMALANFLLGRKYQIKGKVIRGRGIGKDLGFPTANIDFTDYYLPKRGVYMTEVTLRGKRYDGLTNVGKNPTFRDRTMSLETYIMDFEHDVYDELLTIEFIEFMRDEIKYSNKDALVRQIKKDVERAKEKLKGDQE